MLGGFFTQGGFAFDLRLFFTGADDDPRALRARQGLAPTASPAASDRAHPAPQRTMAGGTPAPAGGIFRPGSTLGDINEQLRQFIPSFAVAGMPIEPVFLAGLVLAMLAFGIRGAIVLALAYFFYIQQARNAGQ